MNKDTILLGDVHLGRTFKNGVPLDRRGEIEELFFKTFEEKLNTQNCTCLIQLGDLFDSPVVSFDVLMRAKRIIENVKDKELYFIAGNHDLHRNPKNVPAIRVLAALLSNQSNVHFVIDQPVRLDEMLLVPWSYEKDFSEQFKESGVRTLLGHFEEPLKPEIMAFNGDVYSGHIHKAHKVAHVNFVGSILPIAFGEENDNTVMETVDLRTLSEMSEDDLRNKRIRVVLKEGESLPTDVNCLQLIGKKENKSETEDGVQLDVALEDFDFAKLFKECLAKSGKGEELWAKYLTLR